MRQFIIVFARNFDTGVEFQAQVQSAAGFILFCDYQKLEDDKVTNVTDELFETLGHDIVDSLELVPDDIAWNTHRWNIPAPPGFGNEECPDLHKIVLKDVEWRTHIPGILQSKLYIGSSRPGKKNRERMQAKAKSKRSERRLTWQDELRKGKGKGKGKGGEATASQLVNLMPRAAAHQGQDRSRGQGKGNFQPPASAADDQPSDALQAAAWESSVNATASQPVRLRPRAAAHQGEDRSRGKGKGIFQSPASAAGHSIRRYEKGNQLVLLTWKPRQGNHPWSNTLRRVSDVRKGKGKKGKKGKGEDRNRGERHSGQKRARSPSRAREFPPDSPRSPSPPSMPSPNLSHDGSAFDDRGEQLPLGSPQQLPSDSPLHHGGSFFTERMHLERYNPSANAANSISAMAGTQ